MPELITSLAHLGLGVAQLHRGGLGEEEGRDAKRSEMRRAAHEAVGHVGGACDLPLREGATFVLEQPAYARRLRSLGATILAGRRGHGSDSAVRRR